MEVIIPLAKKLFIFFLCKALEFLQTFLWQKLIRARWGFIQYPGSTIAPKN